MRKTLRVDITEQAFYPDVLHLLRRIPEPSLFHTKYPFRHPAAIYSLSLIQLAGDFNRLLKDYAAIRSSQGKLGSLNEQIERSQRILIYSIREHLDDCQMILMCLVDPASVSAQGKSPDDILKAVGFTEQKIFWEGVHNYVDSYLSPIVNKLKHSQGRFRTVVFECPSGDFRPGFYLEEVTEAGIAQPSMKLHKGNSAFSYAKDIRSNLALIFRASHSLQAAIEAFAKRSRMTLLPVENAPLQSGIWREICSGVAKLDTGVFPQEIKSRFFRVEIQPTGEFRIREIEKDQKLSFPQGNIKCTTIAMPDGMTKSYRVPYFAENKPKFK
jgi:hypothetical protein